MTQVDTQQAVRTRVKSSDPVAGDILDFLNEEADLLDRDQYLAWVELLADDVMYTMPRRETVHVKDGLGYDETSGPPATKQGLKELAERNERANVFDRDPRPRFRRFVTNVKVYRTDKENEYAVDSYQLMLRNEYDDPRFDFVSCERRDVVRVSDDDVKLVQRRVIFDQVMISTPLPNIVF
jgi:3-phenylpropionate/cinnamic acid dioxygenase small subunit